MPMYDSEEFINYDNEFPQPKPKTIRTKPEPYCPQCGAKMKLRRPKANQSWNAFWGCGQYPNCNGTRKILSNGKPDMGTIYDDLTWGDSYEPD